MDDGNFNNIYNITQKDTKKNNLEYNFLNKPFHKTNCKIQWQNICFSREKMVSKLWPMLVVVGVAEIGFGVILLSTMLLYADEYDQLYNTEDTRAISFATACISFILLLTGSILLSSIALKRRRFMLVYILLGAILSICIFTLAVFKIHIGILLLRNDIFPLGGKNVLINSPCMIGIAFLLGAVIHFIGNIAVITYYNFKYIQSASLNYELK